MTARFTKNGISKVIIIYTYRHSAKPLTWVVTVIFSTAFFRFLLLLVLRTSASRSTRIKISAVPQPTELCGVRDK